MAETATDPDCIEILASSCSNFDFAIPLEAALSGEEALLQASAQSRKAWDEALCFMAAAVPECEADFLQRVLEEHGGDANRALASLLADQGQVGPARAAQAAPGEEVLLVAERAADPRARALRGMEAALPDCEAEHLRAALDAHGGDGNAALEAVLAAPYPKRPKRPRLDQGLASGASTSSSSTASPPQASEATLSQPPGGLGPEYWFDLEKRQAQRTRLRKYREEALELLLQEFVELRRPGVVKALENAHGFYAIAWRFLSDALGAFLDGKPLPAGLERLTCPRKQRPDKEVKTLKCLRLRDEVLFVRYWREAEQINSKQREARDAYVKQCEAEGLLLECECCFSEKAPDEVAQCSAGHLFCTRCVAQCVEQLLGAGEVHCVHCPSTADCREQLPPGELRRVLPNSLWEGLQKRLQRSSIQGILVDGAGGQVEQCPFCDFVMVMDVPKEQNKIFVCYNKDCGKESCRLCGEENHIPLRCTEVEKKPQTSHRLAVEERMSEALIRYCPSCKRKGLATAILKEEGCNKMTCPNKKCRAWFCYQCNKEIPKQVGYSHFCQHPLDPGKTCKCGKCSLWTSKEDFERQEEQRVMQEGVSFHMDYLAKHPEEQLSGELDVLVGAKVTAKGKKRVRPQKSGAGD